MENSKEKRDTEGVTSKEEVVEEVTKTQVETAEGKVETVTEVDVKEVVSTEVESGTKTGETAAAEEVIGTKEEVVATSDGTIVEEESEKVTIDRAIVADGVSKGAEVASEKTKEVAAAVSDSAPKKLEEVAAAVSDSPPKKLEEVAAAVPESAPKKLEEAALPTSNTNLGESSGVADSVPKENLATNCSGGNQETSEIPRSTENQQFVAATPRTQTSWKNCCGLLDFLKRSHQ